MGINRFPDIRHHWKQDLFFGSDISKINSYNKFSLWNKFLHLNDKKLSVNVKSQKYKQFYLILRSNLKKHLIQMNIFF